MSNEQKEYLDIVANRFMDKIDYFEGLQRDDYSWIIAIDKEGKRQYIQVDFSAKGSDYTESDMYAEVDSYSKNKK